MSEYDNDSPITIDFEQIEQVAQVFFAESAEILRELDPLILNLEAQPHDAAVLNTLFRRIHTLKGSVGAVPGGQLLGSLAHEFESLLSTLKKEQKSATKECIDLFLHSSRLLKLLAEGLRDKNEILPEVLSEVIDLITRYGQFEISKEKTSLSPRAPVIAVHPETQEDGIWLTQAQITEMLKISGEILVLKNHFQFMAQKNEFQSRQSDFNQQLHKISDRFQTQMSTILKVEAQECFKSLTTLVRQASTELNKEVVFASKGFETWIDKNLGRDIHEVMVHLVRNSLDHGIEDAFDRATTGKPSAGQLNLEISEKSDLVLVCFRDDGRGLDRTRILSKAVEKNLCSAERAEQLSDDEVFKFIFHPGFSTKEKVTTISGRGVGMDVVQQVVDKYHGQIRIETQSGQGTSFWMEFITPQHMVMESTMLCAWQGRQMAIPIANIVQIQSMHEITLTEVNHLRYGQWNQQSILLLDYAELCARAQKGPASPGASVLFIRHKDLILGLIVDRIIGEADLMIKSFNALLPELPGFRGTAVLADDQVTYVIDPEKIMQLVSISSKIKEAA